MGKFFELCFFFGLIWNIEGCAAGSKPVTVAELDYVRADLAEPVAENTPERLTSSLTEELIYQLLLGEISAQRGEMEVAVESYTKAIELSQDAGVAERATKIAMHEGDVSALDVAKQWVKLDPKSIEAQRSVAYLYIRAKEDEKALQHLEKLLVLNEEKHMNAFLFVANLLAQIKDRVAAVALMVRLVDRHPSDYQGDFALAKLAILAEEYELAKRRVNQILARKPNFSPAQLLYGRILISSKQKTEALAYYGGLYLNGQANFAIKNTYARLLVDNKQYDLAKDVFQTVLADNPNSKETIYALALLNMQTGDFDSAEQYLLALVKAKFRSNEVQFYLGQLSEERKYPTKAYQWYQKIGQGKYYFEARLRMIDLLSAQGKIDEARDLVQKVRVLYPKLSVKLYLLEAEILEKAGDFDAQMKLYGQALTEYPEDKDVLYNRALLGEKMGRLDILERDLHFILKKNPKDANALNALGYTLAEQTDRHSEALLLIQKAYALKPEDAAVVDSMGWIQYKLGFLAAAETYLRKAYALLPDSEIAAHLSEILYKQGAVEESKKIWGIALEKDPENQYLLKLKTLYDK